MKYIKNTLDFHVEEPTVISLGKFDGIHRGHELLMEKLAQKKEEGLKAAILPLIFHRKKCGAYRGKGAYHERGENAYF
ncbi:riboflavin biosynthesis protein RibF [human gut metagenome]|uniref:FAD synthase n=1 Tax=human gut metagenome TaxID=408170 RepID=K1RF53_9ZZZZ